MSVSAYAYVLYGYRLEREDLIHRVPNPLWGKAKYDPDTGKPVTQFVTEETDLSLDDGNTLGSSDFERRDRDDYIMLGVVLGESDDLMEGSGTIAKFVPLSPEEEEDVETHAKKLLEEAGVEYHDDLMGYHLVGYASC